MVIQVCVELLETSQPVELAARNTYTKGPLFCVLCTDGRVVKFPVSHLFRVTELGIGQ